MKKFKTAVIGTGFIGVVHVEALRRLGNVEVVAICDTFNVEAKAKQLYINNAFTDYKKMMDQLDLDFVHVCTPNNTHYPIAKYALENNINVVLEKPLTLNIQEAKELTELAESKNLINAVNYHNRLYPACAYAKTLVEQGKIGEVFSVNGTYIQDWLLYDTDYSWRLNSNESGLTRAVADIGSHWMDLVEYITGNKITEVLAEFKTVYPRRKKSLGDTKTFSTNKADTYELIDIDTEDIAMIMYRFDNGAVGNATFSQMTAGIKNRIEILLSGDQASLEWNLADLTDLKVRYRDKPTEVISKDPQLMPEVKSLIDFPSEHMEGFPDAFKQVFKQVYNQPEIKLYANFKAGLRQMILNEKIFESARTNAWVKIDEVK
ncbi:Gfo/Idh/MocA family oxidoreductase [Mycoplasmatota bacterium WC30]